MDWKSLLIRLVVLALAAAGGMTLFSLAFHGLVMLQLVPDQINGVPAGTDITTHAAYAMMASIAIGVIGVFIRPNWRYVLLLAPLYGPTLFAIIYTLINQQPADLPIE
jgi:hypothetical protein